MRIVLPLIAALALSTSAAMAADTAAMRPPMHKQWMQQRHARWCENLYPRAVGKIAYLEAKLKLTSQQKPLFERWKSVRLASVKAHAKQCSSMTPPGPGIMAKLNLEQRMLEARLSDIKAERPSLKALVASLSDNQQRILEREAMKARHHRFDMMRHGFHHRGWGHHRGMRHGMWHGKNHGMGRGAPPPAAPAQ